MGLLEGSTDVSKIYLILYLIPDVILLTNDDRYFNPGSEKFLNFWHGNFQEFRCFGTI